MFQSNLLGFLGVMMHERCPVCGLAFLRETGYYLGAMYVSYGLGVLTILPLGVLLAVVLEWSLAVVIPLVIVLAVLCMPVFMRYSRVIWLHLDQAIDPR
jgi:hypothetical protein